MISESNPCFQNNPQGFQMYEGNDGLLPTLLYNLSVLKDKVHQVQSLVNAVVSPDQIQQESLPIVVSGAGTLIQEIIVAASSMMYPLQQAALGVSITPSVGDADFPQDDHVLQYLEGGRTSSPSPIFSRNNYSVIDHKKMESAENIVELDAADLLGKYTHYCHVCGKGFKRDANLRMHMRAHGDEYKTNAALRNPMKGNSMGQKDYSMIGLSRKYSCPQEGCRWNKKHAKFQPLKSMICAKNHYKRSHCPKLFVCNRCKRKQFSVLSDLRTHEKHCGDIKWRCSCGTTFSRKDKLMGHAALFVGHAPALDSFMKEVKL